MEASVGTTAAQTLEGTQRAVATAQMIGRAAAQGDGQGGRCPVAGLGHATASSWAGRARVGSLRRKNDSII